MDKYIGDRYIDRYMDKCIHRYMDKYTGDCMDRYMHKHMNTRITHREYLTE